MILISSISALWRRLRVTFVMASLSIYHASRLPCDKINSKRAEMASTHTNSPGQKKLGNGETGEQTSPLPKKHGTTGTAILLADTQGLVTGCNEAVHKILGWRASEIIGQPLESIIFANHEAISERKQEILDAVQVRGHYAASRVVQSKSGQSFTANIFVSMFGNGRQSCGMAAIVWVTEKPSAPPLEHLEQTGTGKTPADEVTPPACREIDGTKLILASPVMHRFMRMVDRVAGHTESVLITGETGTGKELIARSLHQSSHRRSRPWVDINCAALPENLVESELFGYEKGAFTGADASKAGLFELADKGTLFLDEIGELQTQTQVKLLRVLDGYPFYRLGGHRKIKVDVRIVAATNQDLDAAVAAGRFRQDLFHRLGQFQLHVPPLRERPEDVVALAEHFLNLKNLDRFFAPDAVSELLSHSWPGNVRELRNLVARIAVESSQPEIQRPQIAAAMSGNPVTQRQAPSIPVGNLESMEEQMIIRALERSGGHRANAAEQLGISRRTLSRKLKEYSINVNPGEGAMTLGSISLEQQKFFRARIQLAVTLKNQQGEETAVQGVNLSTGGMGLDGLKEPMKFTGLLDVSFPLPDSEIVFRAKARIVWFGGEGRVGLRFAVIDPTLFEQLQHWTNKKMKDEGWELPPQS
jgi:PAS domain S-box-containing protein